MQPNNVSSIDQKRIPAPDPRPQLARKKQRSATVPQTTPVRCQIVTTFVDAELPEVVIAESHSVYRECIEVVLRQEWQKMFARFPEVAAYYRNRRLAA